MQLSLFAGVDESVIVQFQIQITFPRRCAFEEGLVYGEFKLRQGFSVYSNGKQIFLFKLHSQ